MNFGLRDWTLQQDEVPSYNIKITHEFSLVNFPNFSEKDQWPNALQI